MIEFTLSGSFDNLESFLKKISALDITSILSKYAQDGVAALSAATPIETGIAAHSWDFEVSSENGVYEIYWINTDVESGFPVVIMLQMGHGTGTGGYVQGKDFINPAIRPIFDEIADNVWKAVTSK